MKEITCKKIGVIGSFLFFFIGIIGFFGIIRESANRSAREQSIHCIIKEIMIEDFLLAIFCLLFFTMISIMIYPDGE